MKAGGWRTLRVTTHLLPRQLTLFNVLHDWLPFRQRDKIAFFKGNDKFTLQIIEDEMVKLVFGAPEELLKHIIQRLWMTLDFLIERSYLLASYQYRDHLVLALAKFANEWQLLRGEITVYRLMVLDRLQERTKELTIDDLLMVGIYKIADELGKLPHTLVIEMKGEFKPVLRALGVEEVYLIPRYFTRSSRILRRHISRIAKSLGWRH